MAIIFQKTASDKCLILEGRESFLYPFNVGPYSSVKVGMYISVTSSTGNDTFYGGNEYVQQSTFANIFVGFAKTGTNYNFSLPYNSGFQFLGLTCPFLQPFVLNNTQISFSVVSDEAAILLSNYTGGSLLSQNPGVLGAAINLPNDPTLSTGYATFYGFAATFNTNTYSFSCTRSSGSVITPNISSLRVDIDAYSGIQIATGFYTSGFDNSTQILEKPDTVFLYFPFSASRVRIHAITVEKIQ